MHGHAIDRNSPSKKQNSRAFFAERPVVPAAAPDRVFQDPGIGEVSGVHDVTVPDPDDLDRRRRERPARRG
jgi:hypothetical protein